MFERFLVAVDMNERPGRREPAVGIVDVRSDGRLRFFERALGLAEIREDLRAPVVGLGVVAQRFFSQFASSSYAPPSFAYSA